MLALKPLVFKAIGLSNHLHHELGVCADSPEGSADAVARALREHCSDYLSCTSVMNLKMATLSSHVLGGCRLSGVSVNWTACC